jgi:transcription initiation factor TFIIB
MPEKAIQEAKRIYKQAAIKELNKGRDNTTMAYASTYIACTIYHIPKTPLEIVIETSVSRVKMLRYAKLITKKLELTLNITDPIDLIPRIASRLKSSQVTFTKAIELLEMVKGSNITAGRKPETTAAACIYLAGKMMGDKKTQREVSNATGVLEVTIRKRSKEILELIRSFK